jgi:phosphoserine phosphatase
MPYVATLISHPDKPAVTDAVVGAVRSALPGAGEPAVLDPGIAVDIAYNAGEAAPRQFADDLRARIAPAPVDIVLQNAGQRKKKLFLADMDSTMIDQECIDELADFAGLKAHVAAITERAMRGEIEFESALRERVALLKGLPDSVIDEVIEKRITLASGARTLVATLRKHGAYTCLVSGGFTRFTEKIAAMIGFQEQRANILEVEDGKLKGLVREPILGRDAKLAALRDLTTKLKLKPEETIAIGDGANDLAMLGEAGLGVAIHAKPAVAATAAARIDHGDLTALLYLQGYRREQFAE